MSDPSRPLHITVYGEWWYYAGVVRWSLDQRKISIIDSGTQPDGYFLTTRAGRITFSSEHEHTTIRVDQISQDWAPDWAALLNTIKLIADEAREARHISIGRTYDEAIQAFYRAKARGTKITMRQIADATGLNYGTLRKMKMAYDARGGWGSGTNE